MNIALNLNSSFSLCFSKRDETCWEYCQLLDHESYIIGLL